MTFRVFMSSRHPGDGYAKMQADDRFEPSTSGRTEPISAEDLHSALIDVDACVSVIPDRFDDGVFTHFPRLKCVANVAVGFDNVDIDAANKHGVLVLNTPGVLDATTADFAFALLLSAARRVVEADRYVRSGAWTTWSFDLMLGTDLGGKTIGIIGLGRIGQAMAKRAVAFGMKVIYTQRQPVASEIAAGLGSAEYLPLDELLKRSDFISIHCPLTEETRHLLRAEHFAMMKQSAILINTARGAIIDESAMVAALQAGKIYAAGLDVFEREPAVSAPLLTMPNVVLAPHIGSASMETRAAMASLAVSGLMSALTGTKPSNVVNPEVWDKFSKRLQQ